METATQVNINFDINIIQLNLTNIRSVSTAAESKSRQYCSEEIETVEENIERAITPPYMPVQDTRYKKKVCIPNPLEIQMKVAV